MNWDRARAQVRTRDQQPLTQPLRGPSGKQQQLIAKLCRELELDYTQPATRDEASEQISSMLAMAERQRRARKPTRKQLNYVRLMLRRLGTDEELPKTFSEASEQIKRLKTLTDQQVAAERDRQYRRRKNEARHRRQASAVKHPGSSPPVEIRSEHGGQPPAGGRA